VRASFVRVFGESIKAAGFFPKVGTTPEDHLRNILNQKEMVLVLEDNKNGKPFETMYNIKTASRDFTLQSRGMVGQDVDFVAIRNHDESE
jgi:hypothetical protein